MGRLRLPIEEVSGLYPILFSFAMWTERLVFISNGDFSGRALNGSQSGHALAVSQLAGMFSSSQRKGG